MSDSLVDSARLRAAGFWEIDRAKQLLRELLVIREDGAAADGPHRMLGVPGDVVSTLSSVADPDLALMQLVRLREAAEHVLVDLLSHSDHLARCAAVMGASRALGDLIVTHPDFAAETWTERAVARDALLESVGADPRAEVPVAGADGTADDMRLAYRRLLLRIAADDLAGDDPVGAMPLIARRLSNLADGALEAGLALARRDVDPGHTVRLAVIAMGKTGARELNYISDVDVVYVAEPAAGADVSDRDVVEIGTRLASLTAQACSGGGEEQPLWAVDAALRPEGRDGALVRTLDSFDQYYSKWAETWEYQALLKARHAAGDAELGQAFEHLVAPYVWSAAGRDGFVENARAMRLRVEQSIPRKDVDREIKLGRGGLRDVEFTVQLLQLVHGRADETLRVRDTVSALQALSAGGYVGREDAAELIPAYCFLRVVEHRTQMFRMRRTHLMPTAPAELRMIGRSIDRRLYAAPDALEEKVEAIRKRVRGIHEDVFYRPIILATAQLSPDEAALDEDAAMARLQAFGYKDPRGALAHIAALTQGTSRRASIQRHLLPVFMSWMADGADPDLGLLSFRTLSEQIGNSHWYLGLLRDSGVAASRLCHVLPNSRWVADALEHRPEAIAWLGDDEELAPIEPARLRHEVHALVTRHPDSDSAGHRVRSVRAREVTRAGLADVVGGVEAWRPAIAEASDAALGGALEIALRERAEEVGGQRLDMAIVAMGRYGGRESSYASDADIMVVHAARDGVADADAAADAIHVATRLKALMASTNSQMSLGVDMDLRPEGRSGPLSRTVDSYADYYRRWSSTWERQALIRARVVAGDEALGTRFDELIDPIRWEEPLTDEQLRDIRLLKARMETERLPRGIDPTRHVKLGPGGLTDVEWVVQLGQMRHAADHPALRTTSTLEALDALVAEGLMDVDDAETLRTAWSLATRIRAGNVLSTGRTSGPKLDVLGREYREIMPVARILGYAGGHEFALDEDWLRAARKCRAVMDRLFWETPGDR